MTVRQRRRGARFIRGAMALAAMVLLVAGLIVQADSALPRVPTDDGASTGPSAVTAPELMGETRHHGIDGPTAWSRLPGGAGPRGVAPMLYDNGTPLDDFRDPASQFSLDADGAPGAPVDWRFVAASADDFILEDFVAPLTNYNVTTVRVATVFFQPGSDDAIPSQSWSEGVYVTVYGNSFQNKPDGVPDVDPTDPGANTVTFVGNVIASQLVQTTAPGFAEAFVDDGACRPYWLVDIPVDFVLAKNTRYWLSVVPRFAAPPQTAWCNSQDSRGFTSHWGFEEFGVSFWSETLGNLGSLSCTDPPAPPTGSHKDLSFQIFGSELDPTDIACCDESTGTCTDVNTLADCNGPFDVATVGASCAFVTCTAITGACCDDASPPCVDDVSIAACQGVDQRFEPGVDCIDLDPVCGTTVLGACCLPAAACLDLTPTECSQTGGDWAAGDCFTVVCPPDDDTCDNATNILVDGVYSFTTIGATTDGPMDSPGGTCTDVENDVWFRYVSSCTGDLVVALCLPETNYDAALAVYDGCFCGDDLGVQLGCDDDACGPVDGPAAVVVAVQAGRCYMIRVGGDAGATGSGALIVGCLPPLEGACCRASGFCEVTIEADCQGLGEMFTIGQPCSPITCPGPNNDDCVNAIALSVDSLPFSTTGATTDGPDDSPGGVCTDVNQDVWFAYTATCDGAMTASLCGAADYDTAMAVYEGCGCAPIGPMLGCDNDGCGPGGASEVILPVTAGTCYLIRLGGPDAEAGAGVLAVSCDPDVVVCCPADVNRDDVLDFADVAPMVTALLAPPLPDDPSFCAADADGNGVIDGRDIQPFVDVMISGDCDVLVVSGACCEASGDCTVANQEGCLALGGSYAGNGTDCSPNNCTQPPVPPVNDDCTSAIMLTCNVQFVVDNTLASSGVDDPDLSCRFGGGASVGTVWYEFTASSTDALISTCNTSSSVSDTIIAVFDVGGACPPFSPSDEIACSEDAGGSCDRLSEVCVEGLIPGNVYTFVVASFDNGSRGPITVDLKCPCPLGACCFFDGGCQVLRPDQCIAAGGTYQGDDTLCDPNSCPPAPPLACCVGDLDDNGVVDLGDTTDFVDALLNPPAAQTQAFCRADANEDGWVDGRDIAAMTALVINQTTCPPPANDICENATGISCGDRLLIENSYATTSASDPAYSCRSGGPGQGAGTLWFAFTAEDTSVHIDTCNSISPADDTILALYDGSCPLTLGNEIACNEDAGLPCGERLSELCATGLTPGATYYIQVSSFDVGSLGIISLQVDCPCP